MKPILAIDGALGGFSCAVLDGDRLEVRTLGAHSALEGGLGVVDAVLRACGLRPAGLAGIAVGLGPGSFTGLRIALSYAKALALGAALPACGISSYDLLEPEEAPLPALSVVVGRPGVICARLRTADGHVARKCGNVAEVIAAFEPARLGPLSVAGASDELLADLRAAGASARPVAPRDPVAAVALVRMARERGFPDDPRALRPDYGEAPATTAPKKNA